MSFINLYEYMHGEFQDVTRVPLAAAGVDPAWIIDPNGVKIAGHTIELWDAATGGTQLLEGVDYSLVFLDSGKTAAEGIDIWAGYQVLNVAYQGIPLYLTARIIGGYTKHNGGIIFDEAIGDQWVTKWDTGRVEMIGTGSVLSTGDWITSQNLFGSTSGGLERYPLTITLQVPMISANIAISLSSDCNGGRAYSPSLSTLNIELFHSERLNRTYKWQIIGRWK